MRRHVGEEVPSPKKPLAPFGESGKCMSFESIFVHVNIEQKAVSISDWRKNPLVHVNIEQKAVSISDWRKQPLGGALEEEALFLYARRVA